MNRRNFIRLLGSGLFVPLVEPQIKYILPPVGGWQAITPIPGSFATLMIPGLTQIYYDYLVEKGAFKYADFDISTLRQKYLDMRAENGIYPFKR
jgi:hypothetical protein